MFHTPNKIWRHARHRSCIECTVETPTLGAAQCWQGSRPAPNFIQYVKERLSELIGTAWEAVRGLSVMARIPRKWSVTH
jgi:hypothetical protein